MLKVFETSFTRTEFSYGLQSFEPRLIQYAGRLGIGSSGSSQYFLQFQNLGFWNEHSILTMSPSIMPKSAGCVDQRLSDNVELEAEGSHSPCTPLPQGLCADACNDSRSILDGPVFGAIGGDIWGDLFHPGTEARQTPESNCDIFAPDRGFVRDYRDQADGFWGGEE